MKIRIELVDDAGVTYEGEVTLTRRSPGKGRPKLRHIEARVSPGATPTLPFDGPLRPFLQNHARGRPGDEIFTLLVAFHAKGRTGVGVELATIKKAWTTNKTILRLGFNPSHTNHAQTRGWVTSSTRGTYELLDGWHTILGKQEQ